MSYVTYPDNLCPKCRGKVRQKICVPIRCGVCGKYDYDTPSCTRCNDCCFARKRDVSGRLLASRCKECCPSGHGLWEPLGTITIELEEQIELLLAVEKNVESRILKVETPFATLSQAERLEKIAEETYDTAQRIRESLAEDTERFNELLLEAVKLQLTIATMRMELQRGVRRSAKGYIQKIVDEFLKQKCGNKG